MHSYGRHGLENWNSTASQSLKDIATDCLGANRIVETEYELTQSLKSQFNQSDLRKQKFVPIPHHPGKQGFECGFFLPIRRHIDGVDVLSFELFLLVGERKGLAFRIEPAEDGTHDYAHVQMCQRLLRRNLPFYTAEWLPDSYPAFPAHARNPTELFLYMATAVHGRTGGLLDVLVESFRRAGRSILAPRYVSLVKDLYN
jgi:hypothetical protein